MEKSGQEETRDVNLAKKREGLAETVGELLAFNDERGLWLILNRPHRADLGRCCAQLNNSHRQRIFPLLAGELAADVLAELDTLTMFYVAEDLAYLRQTRDDEQLFYLYVLDACIGVAMLAAILFSAALGLLVPLFFRSIGLDPAVASGLLITTLSDVFSLAIYFAIATISLHVLF